MGSIFLSYRREDTEGQAGRLYDDLVAVFGSDSVFMDVAAIQPGRDFRKSIDQSLNSCGVFLSLIGRSWLTAKDTSGQSRLNDPEDFVRIETGAALKRDIPVIPVLVQGASAPKPDQLPDDLKELAFRNAVELTHPRWDSDIQVLIKALRPHISQSSPQPEPEQVQPGGDRPAEPDDIEGSPPQRAKIGEIIPYALIALASFLCGIGVLGLMLWKAEALTKLGLIGNLYYVVLLPLGLCAAVFLFGVVRSFARYKGEQYGGTLELGGPIVAFVLVVGGGFVLVPKPPSTFPLTVYVHGEAARSDLVLRNSGRVFVDLDGDRQSRSIGENGEAYFPAIPDRFRGQEVPIWVDATGFESTIVDQKQRVDGGSLYLPVRKKSGHVSGRVQDQDGNPISGAELSVAGMLTHSDVSGHFEFIITGDKLEQEMDLQAVAQDYKTQKYKVVPNANELTVTLPTAP